MSRNVNPTTRGEVLMVGGYIEEGDRTILVSPDTMTDGDFQVASDLTAAGAVAITLPSAGVGKVFRVRDKKGDAGTNNITVTAPAGETIEGAGSATINVNYGALTLRKSSSTTWHVVSRNFNTAGTAGSFTTLTTSGLLTIGGGLAATASALNIADPGNAGAIPVTRSGVCNTTTTGAQTRTLAIPTFEGQTLTICCNVDGGDCVITVASAFNQAGNTIITLNDAGDAVHLIGAKIAGALRWRLVANDGATLS